MNNYKDHLIQSGALVKDALIKINNLGLDIILFVVNRNSNNPSIYSKILNCWG